MALYAFARLGLVAVIALLLGFAGVPLLVALLVALVVALPLSMVLFRGLRARLDRAVATATARRSAERESLRAQLRGDVGPPPAPEQDAPAGADEPPARDDQGGERADRS
nr:DUF4229 domain-containing protein [Pseudonocardia sp. Ae707_Ps1]